MTCPSIGLPQVDANTILKSVYSSPNSSLRLSISLRCFTSISATVLGKNTFLTLVSVFGSFNTNAVWLLERAGGNLNTTPFSFNYSRASQLTF